MCWLVLLKVPSVQFNRFSQFWFGMLILIVFYQSFLYFIPKSLFPRRVAIVWIPKKASVRTHNGLSQILIEHNRILSCQVLSEVHILARNFKSHPILNDNPYFKEFESKMHYSFQITCTLSHLIFTSLYTAVSPLLQSKKQKLKSYLTYSTICFTIKLKR